MIAWITVIIMGKNAAIQVHSSLQISEAINVYLIVQSLEPFVKAILGYFLSKIGIMLSIPISSLIKVTACFRFHKIQESLKHE